VDSGFHHFPGALRETVPLKGINHRELRVKTVYYDNHGPENQPGFRNGGTAWWVRSEPDRLWDEHFAEFPISEPLYWALFHLGIIDDFYQLPYEGLLGAYEEGILRSSGLSSAYELLRQRAQHLSPGTYEWLCSTQMSADKIQYKIRVTASALKGDLLALADFFKGAAGRGFDVQLWL
jgi:hypothetical protein